VTFQSYQLFGVPCLGMQTDLQCTILQKLCEDLAPLEAAHLLVTCRKTAASLECFAGALCFALSRLELDHTQPLDMKVWQNLWEDCAHSLVACSIDPSMWAYSHYFKIENSSCGHSFPAFRFSKGTASPLLAALFRALPQHVSVASRTIASDEQEHTESLTIAAILYVDVDCDEYGTGTRHVSIQAFAVLSDTSLVFILCHICEGSVRDFDEDRGSFTDYSEDVSSVQGAAYVGGDLQSLFTLAGEFHGNRCEWNRYQASGPHGQAKKLMTTAHALDMEDLDSCEDTPDRAWVLACHRGETELDRVQDDRCSFRLKSCWDNMSFTSPSTVLQNPDSPMLLSSEHVIETLEHSEPPAIRDAQVTSLQADVQWADDVEQRIREDAHSSVASELPPSSHYVEEKVYVLRFGSPPSGGGLQQFRDMLLQSGHLKTYRDAMRMDGNSCQLPGGALMFVLVEQVEAVRHALQGMTLHNYHVVVTEGLEYLIDEVLATFCFQERPKRKTGDRGRSMLSYSSAEESVAEEHDSEDDAENHFVLLVEERTFLSLTHVSRDARSVVQSTTEALNPESHGYYSHFRGSNPRRLA